MCESLIPLKPVSTCGTPSSFRTSIESATRSFFLSGAASHFQRLPCLLFAPKLSRYISAYVRRHVPASKRSFCSLSVFHSFVSFRRKTLTFMVWKRKDKKQGPLLYHACLASVSSLLFQQSCECRMSIKREIFSSLLSFFSTRISTTTYSIHTHILHPYLSYTRSPHAHRIYTQRSSTHHTPTVSPYTSIST